ncbi:MAG: GNAT family N-acetyltransferase [Candidatus Lokiarchaeota archaeon]|nr:GNAT family N-acetyltransferase [Candidatus Lokiarchaeota archaeon]
MRNFDHSEKKPEKITLEDLSRIIKPGFRIFLGTGCSEPYIITKELTHDKYRWTDCEIVHLLTLTEQKFFSDSFPTRFRHNTLSLIGSAQTRHAVNTGKSDFTPIRTSEIPDLLERGVLKIDVAMVQLSPPDEYGYCSLGINVDINKKMVEYAKIIIAQINSQMPSTRGDSTVRIDQLDYIIEENTPLVEYKNEYSPSQSNIIDKICSYTARLIEDGATLNFGLGKIPLKIFSHLQNRKDLAIYTESLVMTDALFDLISKNVITCKLNHYPKVMCAFALGEKRHYQRVHNNPFIKFYPTEFINNVDNIIKNHKLISIYSAIAVDLSGQITNHLEDKFYSGIGGENDFIEGTSRTPGGKTIIVIPSTTSDGEKSRIVPIISRSTIPASDVHYIITEYGIARLTGKPIRQRAIQLIAIAHPKFRKSLLQQAKKMHFVYPDQLIPLTRDGNVVVYPEEYEWIYSTNSGNMVKFRAIKPTDEALLQRFFYQQDERSRILRYLTPKKTLTHEESQIEVNIDYDTNMVIVGLVGDEDAQEIIAAASYYLDPEDNTNIAEVAIMISKEWQNQGLGHHMFSKMCYIAHEKGLNALIGEFMKTNIGVDKMLKNLPFPVEMKDFDETFEFIIDLTREKP